MFLNWSIMWSLLGFLLSVAMIVRVHEVQMFFLRFLSERFKRNFQMLMWLYVISGATFVSNMTTFSYLMTWRGFIIALSIQIISEMIGILYSMKYDPECYLTLANARVLSMLEREMNKLGDEDENNEP